ncbi:transmembrane protein 14C-like protein [Halteromyces radiatus]|uniref:transmembrane protein 14C-like protein n=1 Tax=Halteromyces radiatus TaxID=101107 RepID=UPI00221E3CD9|nr:transmembrane protein 14C-like protein [Halteromyces radiatus]KAI8097445.1 transmembrane protein 14C-like protein [Halteromyces radiatus]
MTDYLGYIYSLLVFTGGVIGYVKAGSTISLAASSVFGFGAAYGATLVSRNPKNVGLSLVVSLVLLLVMGLRFNKSGKFMPAGLVSLLSFVMVARYGYQLL